MKLNVWRVTGRASSYDLDGDETPNISLTLALDFSFTEEEVIDMVCSKLFRDKQFRNVSLKADLLDVVRYTYKR